MQVDDRQNTLLCRFSAGFIYAPLAGIDQLAACSGAFQRFEGQLSLFH